MGLIYKYEDGNSVTKKMISKNILAKEERSNQDNTRVSKLPIKTLEKILKDYESQGPLHSSFEGKVNNNNAEFYINTIKEKLKTNRGLTKYKSGGLIYKYGNGDKITTLTPKDFTLQYIKSPKYKERLQNSGYPNIGTEIKNRYNNVNSTNTIVEQNGPLGFWNSIMPALRGDVYSQEGGSNASYPNTILLDTKQVKDLGTTKEDVLAHEFSHKETGTNRGERLNKKDVTELTKRLNPKANINAHDSGAHENKADLNALRYELQQKGVDVFNKDITPEDLKKVESSKKFSSNRLFNNYKPEDLLWLLNNVAKNKESKNNSEDRLENV
jgi:hypothetical protein